MKLGDNKDIHVERRYGNTDIRTSKSREGNPAERIKSWESNTMVRTVEGSPMGHIKSR